MKNVFAIAPFVFLAACEASLPKPDVPPRGPALPVVTDDTCDANQYSSLIGQDATALERVLLLGEVRVIRPGQAVTMDFRPERINFVIGRDNRIESIRCN